jgi:hypothetical protein
VPLKRSDNQAFVAVRNSREIVEAIAVFLKEHQLKSAVTVHKIIGYPQEEGIDYPENKRCPRCPFWAGRDRFAHERIK